MARKAAMFLTDTRRQQRKCNLALVIHDLKPCSHKQSLIHRYAQVRKLTPSDYPERTPSLLHQTAYCSPVSRWLIARIIGDRVKLLSEVKRSQRMPEGEAKAEGKCVMIMKLIECVVIYLN
ncbi:hypothetical protein CAPTEDRAFT_217327 [Capitella teleta]|uniref:Uncharacterized protein n=1 Tax=Capitella teleta TaxID=283909 RepID=R7VEE9_CAPTE|nr:hypothetical protein CAPTEDRAFT_217327 [Capitella teleta]|eukprot:ELU16962.1 hypothetical protein CAPTEDRAFT_217327 [Capitella teleta]